MIANTSGASLVLVVALGAIASSSAVAQTREKGPWWPSKYGPTDQAGNTNTVTPQK
ncbi:MAG: hypothetical protein RLZZ403_201, partial [Pseudomonadota bacterium]